jgi:hypothetical protein
MSLEEEGAHTLELHVLFVLLFGLSEFSDGCGDWSGAEVYSSFKIVMYLTFQLVFMVPEVPSLARTLKRFCFALKNVCPKFILAVGNSHVYVYLFFTMR